MIKLIYIKIKCIIIRIFCIYAGIEMFLKVVKRPSFTTNITICSVYTSPAAPAIFFLLVWLVRISVRKCILSVVW